MAESFRLSEADREALLRDDPHLSLLQEHYSAEADQKVRSVRVWIFVAILFFLGMIFFAYSAVKVQTTWMSYRPGFIWANAQGTPMLVTAETKDKSYDAIPDSVVNATIMEYLDMRYGVSEYHSRVLWPRMMTYWLKPTEVRSFFERTSQDLLAYRKENLWRRVTISYIQVDKRDPISGGGTRYDAQVEFLTDDLKADEGEPKRTQWWRIRLSFTLGTPYGVTDREQFERVSKFNPLNWRNVTVYEPVSIAVPTRRSETLPPQGSDSVVGTPSLAAPASTETNRPGSN